MHRTNALRKGSSNTPFTTAHVPPSHSLVGTISLAVDYNSSAVGADWLMSDFVCCVVSTLTWKLKFVSCWNSGAKLIDSRDYLSVLVAFIRELTVVTGTVDLLMCWRLNERSWRSQFFLNDVRNHDSGLLLAFRMGLEGLALITLPGSPSLLLCHS